MTGRQRQWLEQRLVGIERLVQEIRRFLESAVDDAGAAGDPGYLSWFKKMGGFLNGVEQAGVRLPQAQLLAIAKKHGYDPRGTAGFYRGAAPLLQANQDGTRELTMAGRERAKEWRETFGHRAA